MVVKKTIRNGALRRLRDSAPVVQCRSNHREVVVAAMRYMYTSCARTAGVCCFAVSVLCISFGFPILVAAQSVPSPGESKPVRIPIEPSLPTASSSTFATPVSPTAPLTLISPGPAEANGASGTEPDLSLWRRSVTAATAATVRLRVIDGSGHSLGTGTLVDVRDNQALIVTCGHIFNASQGRGEIEIDFFQPQSLQTRGKLLVFDRERDLGVVTIDLSDLPTQSLPAPLSIAPIAAGNLPIRQGMRVFSVGCDHGNSPTVMEGFLSAQNRYQGPANLTASGVPVEGRSGGGLFDAGGRLIGICQAAVPSDNEGLYGAWTTLIEKLDEIQFTEVHRRPQNQSSALVRTLPPTSGTANVATGGWKSGEPTSAAATATGIVAERESFGFDFNSAASRGGVDARSMAQNMPAPAPVVQYTGLDPRGSIPADRHPVGTSLIGTEFSGGTPTRTAGEMMRGAGRSATIAGTVSVNGSTSALPDSPLRSVTGTGLGAGSGSETGIATRDTGSNVNPEDLEVVCIIRQRGRGNRDDDIVVIRSPSEELLRQITEAGTRTP